MLEVGIFCSVGLPHSVITLNYVKDDPSKIIYVNIRFFSKPLLSFHKKSSEMNYHMEPPRKASRVPFNLKVSGSW